MTRPDDSLVTIGSAWFVWGDHHRVVEERNGKQGYREVRLTYINGGRSGKKQPWVEAWRVAKWGQPSEAYG